MSKTWQSKLGEVLSLWRYPVKSMMGEEVSLAQVNAHGLVGDRSYAILDPSDGKVATAKNPRKWPTLFAFKARCLEVVDSHESVPLVRITLPDGTVVTSEQVDLNQVLSKAFNRKVTLLVTDEGRVSGVQSSLPTSWTANSEEYWPDMDGRDHRDAVTQFTLPTGTFFDAAKVHLLTTSTLNHLRQGYPDGCFDVQRFRPNIVVDVVRDESLSRKLLDRADPGHWKRRSSEYHWSLRSLCDDHLTPGKSSQGSWNITHGAPRQSWKCWCLCGSGAEWHDSSG